MDKTKHSVDICVDSMGPALINKFESYRKALVELVMRKTRIRFVTEITKVNVDDIKELAKISNDVRHLDGCKGNFVINEAEYLSIIVHNDYLVHKLVYSDVSEIVEQQHYVFDTLWNLAIPYQQRIEQIEQGYEPEFLEVIIDRQKAALIFSELVKSVKKEALFLLPSAKALIRFQRLGLLDPLLEASEKNGAIVKIICLLTDKNSEIAERIQNSKIKLRNGTRCPYGMFIADNMKYFHADARDPEADQFTEAIGFVLYSNSRGSVASFRETFELFWNQPVGERALSEEEVREYLESVLNEVRISAADKKNSNLKR
ncbi:MAG TPA: hypothetical protein VH796_08475 [Nitrososphaeraceae archaeon]